MQNEPQRSLAKLSRLIIALVLSLLMYSPSWSQVAFSSGVMLNVDTPESVRSTDFNGDGHLDLVVASPVELAVRIFYGDGQGGFGTSESLPSSSPFDLAFADFDGNGKLDIVTPNILDGSVSIFLAQATGGFHPATTIPMANTPRCVTTADLNGDQHQDFVCVNHGSDLVTIAFGNGDGTFSSFLGLGQVVNPSYVVTGDFTGDGILDLVVSSSLDSNFRTFAGDGAGNFSPPLVHAIGIDDSVWFMMARDLNSDQIPDIVAPCPFHDVVAILLSSPGGGAFEPVIVVPAGDHPESTEFADVTLDGVPDMVTVNLFSNDFSVNPGTGGTNFGAPQQFASGLQCVSITSHDFNEDGRTDLAVANQTDGTIQVHLNQSVPVLDPFQRGDVNFDTAVDIADPLVILGHLFAAAPPSLLCADAADVQDNGSVDVGDAVYLLSYLFGFGDPPAEPFAAGCGADLTADSLGICDIMGGACP